MELETCIRHVETNVQKVTSEVQLLKQSAEYSKSDTTKLRQTVDKLSDDLLELKMSVNQLSNDHSNSNQTISKDIDSLFEDMEEVKSTIKSMDQSIRKIENNAFLEFTNTIDIKKLMVIGSLIGLAGSPGIAISYFTGQQKQPSVEQMEQVMENAENIQKIVEFIEAR